MRKTIFFVADLRYKIIFFIGRAWKLNISTYFCGMRYIKLTDSAHIELDNIYRTHDKLHVRQRAQCLLLSNKGFSVPQLANIFSTRTHTVRAWFDRWEKDEYQGLDIRSGRGLKPAIKENDTAFVDCIKKEVMRDPRNLQSAVDRINARWGAQLTVGQLRRFLKKK